MNTLSNEFFSHPGQAEGLDGSRARKPRVVGFVPEASTVSARPVMAIAILKFFAERLRRANGTYPDFS